MTGPTERSRPTRRRVLFVGEGSTLAHAARPIALASALPADRYDVLVACPEPYARWIPDRVAYRPLATQPQSRFLGRLATGKPPFDEATLARYVADDLELLGAFKPDVVVGDARVSLAASARVAGVPYIGISNAYWHPHRSLHPEFPVMRWSRNLPFPLLQAMFAVSWPLAFAWTAAPISRALAAHGVDIGLDIRRAWTEADLMLYADMPSLYPEITADDRYRFAGPIAWEPPIEPPDWWERIPRDRPVVYLTLGSSGDIDAVTAILQALGELDWTVLVATAGRLVVPADGRRVFVADFLPGLAACARADLVICNGGSPTTTQALLAGRPVLGVCSNADQFLNMQAVHAAGVGEALRADRLTSRLIEKRLERLRSASAIRAAGSLAKTAAAHDPVAVLMECIEQLTDRRAAGLRP